VGLYWVLGHARVRENEITDKLARDGSVQKFVGPEPFLGVSRQNIRRKIKRWMDNQHLVMWRSPGSTQRQARELTSGPDLATRARLLSFNRGTVQGCHWSSNPTQNPEAKFMCNGAE
jgi:hypothetical protein